VPVPTRGDGPHGVPVAERLELVYTIPLAEVVVDFFDSLKSRTKGYASLDYEPADYRSADLVKIDVLLNGLPVDAFSAVVAPQRVLRVRPQDDGEAATTHSRQMFDVPIQAAIGGRVIARETVKAKRKDVLAKCYGGDITRKRKLLEKQRKASGHEEHRPGGSAARSVHRSLRLED